MSYLSDMLDRIPRSRKFVPYGKGKYIPNRDPLDLMIRHNTSDGMTSGTETLLTIKVVRGFEIFGGYEGWDTGYEVTDGVITVKDKWLDCAIARYVDKRKELLDSIEG